MRKDETQGIRMIAIYGKGGIGKSTVSANVSAALSEMGEKVLQVGCDPKRDSISTLCGKLMPTIMDLARESERFGKISQQDMDSRVFVGFNGILGCEAGGPKPATGCAGKGVNLALELLFQHKVPQRFGITWITFDVLGDAVCGGFATPMRSGYAKEAYLITCGEPLTLFMVNNIARAVKKLHDGGAEVAVAALINNKRGVPNEEEIVEEFGKMIGVPVIAHIPRDKNVQLAEFQGKTVIEAYPNCKQAEVYRDLARKIKANKETYVPTPTNMTEIKKLVTRVLSKV